MNPQVSWYVTRGGGIVAWGLLSAALLWGLALSTRVLGSKSPPAWLLDLHRYLGALSVTFTGVHLAGLVVDDYVHFGWRELLVPMASTWRPGAVAWGIVALYLLVAVEVSSLLMRRLPKRLWRNVHRSSFVLWVTATGHGIAAGADVTNPLYRAATLVAVQAVLVLTVTRLLASRRRRAAAPAR